MPAKPTPGTPKCPTGVESACTTARLWTVATLEERPPPVLELVLGVTGELVVEVPPLVFLLLGQILVDEDRDLSGERVPSAAPGARQRLCRLRKRALATRTYERDHPYRFKMTTGSRRRSETERVSGTPSVALID